MTDPIIKGSVWRHKKTGGLYVVVGGCRLEATRQRAILYLRIDGDGETIVRDAKEFADGRFESVHHKL